MNRFGAGLSTHPRPLGAAARAAAQAQAGLAGAPPDLLLVFIAGSHAEQAEAIVAEVGAQLGRPVTAGAVGVGGVLGCGREIERGPAVVVWAAALPEAAIEVLELRADPDDQALLGWPAEGLGEGERVALILCDGYTLPAERLLKELAVSDPRLPIVGGLAGGSGPGAAELFAEGRLVVEGAVVVIVEGAGAIPVVSQGCRPVGPDLVVTDASANLLLELAGRPAVAKLHEVVDELEDDERELIAEGVLGGLVVDENRPDYDVGDYLVRTLLGADEESGAIAIGDLPRVGQTFRFHVRDPAAADLELAAALRHGRALAGGAPGGALVFSCIGRGSGMFGVRDHDAALVAAELDVPAAGVFCQGEVGPIGGANHLHAFTATLVVFPA